MKNISFYKMSGAGNDFIVIDHRTDILNMNLAEFAIKICHRRMSVGADGLFLIENSEIADFKWQFFNSDGSIADMCGNGARCVARFAYLNGIAEKNMSFETGAGIIHAEIIGENVRIKMTDPQKIILNQSFELEHERIEYSGVDTGVPHTIIKVKDVHSLNVTESGRKIRYHKAFAPAGTNVNFICRKGEMIFNRTYERGVEDETLACGTGCVAAAIIMARTENMKSPIQVTPTSGQTLTTLFSEKDGKFYDVFLEGNARIICKGELGEDAWNWK